MSMAQALDVNHGGKIESLCKRYELIFNLLVNYVTANTGGLLR